MTNSNNLLFRNNNIRFGLLCLALASLLATWTKCILTWSQVPESLAGSIQARSVVVADGVEDAGSVAVADGVGGARGGAAAAGGAPSPSLFPTSRGDWTAERVSSYEATITPAYDPKRERNLVYTDRNRNQTIAEIENGYEVVRYLTNMADRPKQRYNLLVRVLQTERLEPHKSKERWDALVEHFKLPSAIKIWVEFIVDQAENQVLEHLFHPTPVTAASADWVVVVRDTTYVNLKQLVRRLFADIDPSSTTGMGLLHWVNGVMVPIAEAGILFTQVALKEAWEDPKTHSCWDAASIEDWSACLAQSSFVWKGLPGLNPYSSREIVRYALERSLFRSLDQTYKSVGGAIMGTARLPITYGNMVDDDLFYHQLYADTNQGRVPKILHQIWSGPRINIEPEIWEAAQECRAMHEERGWKYMFWDDAKLQNLTGIPKLPDMLASRKRVRYYTDMIRIYLLHQFGGVYTDLDAFCIRPFDPLLGYLEDEGKDFLAGYESEREWGRQIANGVMIAAPASPVLSASALHMGIKIATNKNWTAYKDWKTTGPWAITELKYDWLSWIEPHQIILSSSAFIPVYRTEGEGLSLADSFDIANSHGSYTIQMYQTTKDTNMYKMILASKAKTKPKKAIASASGGSEASDDLHDSTSKEPSVLMIVAHADDELLWGGEYLLKEGKNLQVVVACTQGPSKEINSMRQKEFEAESEHAGFRGEYLDGKDTMKPFMPLEPHLKKHIESLICRNKNWNRIVTHGPEGEYGHPQHQQVHDAVSTAVKKCHSSYDKLFVFEPHPVKNYVFPEAKVALAKHHKSQEQIIFEMFGNWKEQVVPFAKYNFEAASATCLESAKKSHKCRLAKLLDFNSSATQTAAAQWEHYLATLNN